MDGDSDCRRPLPSRRDESPKVEVRDDDLDRGGVDGTVIGLLATIQRSSSSSSSSFVLFIGAIGVSLSIIDAVLLGSSS
jgi:hypothetical protein